MPVLILNGSSKTNWLDYCSGARRGPRLPLLHKTHSHCTRWHTFLKPSKDSVILRVCSLKIIWTQQSSKRLKEQRDTVRMIVHRICWYSIYLLHTHTHTQTLSKFLQQGRNAHSCLSPCRSRWRSTFPPFSSPFLTFISLLSPHRLLSSSLYLSFFSNRLLAAKQGCKGGRCWYCLACVCVRVCVCTLHEVVYKRRAEGLISMGRSWLPAS